MDFQTSKTIISVIILTSALAVGQVNMKKKSNPVIQSAVIPGWGQKSLNHPKRGRVFLYIETGILLTILGTNTYSNNLKKNYVSFASEHANVLSDGKNHKYWVDIGNFNSVTDYNDEHLRNRESGDLYPDNLKWRWGWDTNGNRNTFENKRILSDQMKLAATFGIGAIVLNHMVSAIDALYLNRLKNKNEISLLPYHQKDTGGMGYSLICRF